jgi:hypothetical protein
MYWVLYTFIISITSFVGFSYLISKKDIELTKEKLNYIREKLIKELPDDEKQALNF